MAELDPLSNPFFWLLVTVVPALSGVIVYLYKRGEKEASEVKALMKEWMPFLEGLKHGFALLQQQLPQDHEKTRTLVHSEHVETRSEIKTKP